MKVLGLIPARGGSKGIPRKNIKPLRGKPLLQYTADAALRARRLSRVVLSTEDEEIAEIGRRCGLDVPFLRPAELARDETPTLPVVQHVLKWFSDQSVNWDAVCILQPTNPLRRANDIDGAIALLEESGADGVISVAKVPPEFNPHWVYFRRLDGSLFLATGEEMPIPRRQDLPPAFHREGSVYVTRCRVVLGQGTLYGSRLLGYEIDRERTVSIDSEADWERTERLLSRRR